jgi:hypothetical protein
VKVACHSSTVDRKNPISRPLHPAIRYDTMPSAQGPIQSFLLRKTSSGYLAKSRMRSYSVAAYLSHRIQPTWLQKKPFWVGECTSRSESLYRWWSRWCAAHHSGPFWAAVVPPKAITNCQNRLSR